MERREKLIKMGIRSQIIRELWGIITSYSDSNIKRVNPRFSLNIILVYSVLIHKRLIIVDDINFNDYKNGSKTLNETFMISIVCDNLLMLI